MRSANSGEGEPQHTRPGLAQVSKYIAFRAHAEHPNAAPAERESARRRMDELERTFPGIHETADRVVAALNAHGQRANRGRDPEAPPIDLEAYFSGLSDTSVPWYQRAWRAVRGGVELAPHVASAYRESMAALGTIADEQPLKPKKYEITVSLNAYGEVVVELRAHPIDLRSEQRLVHLMSAAQERVTHFLRSVA